MSMMRNLKVGLFFLSLGAAGTTYVVMSTDGFNRFNTKTYEVVLDDATGLSTNSKVYVAGVPVGKIQTIDLTGGQALIELAFLKTVDIRSDAVISRKSASILGTSILSLDPGSEASSGLEIGSRIGTAAVVGDMNSVLAQAGGLSAQISEILTEFQETQLALLTASLTTFNSMAENIDRRSDAEMDRISRILESTALITERFEKILGERESDLGASADDIRGAIENLHAITSEIRDGRGNLGKALNDEELYNTLLATAEESEKAAKQLNEALAGVNRLTTGAETVVQDAGKIVSKAAGLGVQLDGNSRYDVLSGGFRSGVSLRLEPLVKDRWYRIGVVTAPDGVSSRTVTETAVTGGAPVRTETTKTNFGMAIDAELARQFGMVTLRGGLLENTAGFGLDFQPARWIMVSGELFDFKADTLPNLKGAVTVYPFFDPLSSKPWNWIYIRGGVNSALDDRRDYFIGGGLRFADEEVRGLIGLVPLAGK